MVLLLCMKLCWFLITGVLRREKGKDLQEVFPVLAVTFHPLPQIAELFIYANTEFRGPGRDHSLAETSPTLLA